MNDLTHIQGSNLNLSNLQLASFNLQEAVKAALLAARELYSDAELGDLDIKVKISGRVHGDIKVAFTAGSIYTSDDAEAFDLYNAVLEFIRRKDWGKRHAPQCLTFSGDTKPETPF